MTASNRLVLPGPLASCLADHAQKTDRTPREIAIRLLEKHLLDAGYSDAQLLATGVPQGMMDAPANNRLHHTESTTPGYFLLPATGWGMDSLDFTRRWLDAGRWGMRRSTPNRTNLKAGDLVCFYAKGHGVAALATVTGPATTILAEDEIPLPRGDDHDDVFGVPLTDVKWLETPVMIDTALRASLDAFVGKPITGKGWAWLVQTSRKVSAHDFAILTGQSSQM